MDRLGISHSIDYERGKSQAQPIERKKSKFDGACDNSLNIIFKKAQHTRENNYTQASQDTVEGSTDLDYKLKEMMSSYKARDYGDAIAAGKIILQDMPDNLDALYIVGLSSSMLDRHELTIKCFEQLTAIRPSYKKNVYLFLSIAYKKTNRIEDSFTALNKALVLYKDFFEAYVDYVDQDLPRKTTP